MEDGAERQARNLALHPYTFHHVAMMPDCHEGYGMPIGGVIATKGVIIPYAVGVDIGCGMNVVKTNLHDISLDTLRDIVDLIKEKVPTGHHHNVDSFESFMPKVSKIANLDVIHAEYDSACHQIGTLGGGNHFIEIQKGDNGYIYVMIHSGSRNLGKKVANHHEKIAKEFTENSDVSIPSKWQLDFIATGTSECANYLDEMNYCLQFARANRSLMMKHIEEIILEKLPETSFVESYDVHHNYAALETHYDRKVWVHRKGATSAFRDEVGIIPGSQGTASYIVEGRGNMKSFCSCSHGSGRKMGREEAKRKLNLDDQMALLDQHGIIHDMKSRGKLDEAPGAYKDIEEVIKAELDLIKPVIRLRPLAVIKE